MCIRDRTVPATSPGGHTPTPARMHRSGSPSSTAYKDCDGRLPVSGWPPPLGVTGQAARSRSMSWHGIQGPGRSHFSTTTLAPETSGGERPTQPSVTVAGQRNSGLCREDQRSPQITGLRQPDGLISPTMVRSQAHIYRAVSPAPHQLPRQGDVAGCLVTGSVTGHRSAAGAAKTCSTASTSRGIERQSGFPLRGRGDFRPWAVKGHKNRVRLPWRDVWELLIGAVSRVFVL